jgi:large subunit ribosomal protein L3
MALLLGKKVGMTEVYDQQGRLQPVTVIQAGPCAVMQVKTTETDGYNAVQLGFDEVKPSRRTKPASGHAQKASVAPRKFVREMRYADDAKPEYKAGDSINVSVFEENSFVDVTGISKGKGFQGVMKRYKFAGMPGSHGTERKHRSPGSIASFATDRGHSGKLKKGKRMAGHMGYRKRTTKNHKLLTVDAEKNLLVVNGSVPGPAGGYLIVKTAKNG